MVSLVTELLFSYGTLRQPGVQRSIFGRELDGRADAIVGYDLEYVTITDPRVIAASGSDRHPILKPTDRADAAVEGTVYAVSEANWGQPTNTRSTTTRGSRSRCVQAIKPGSTCSQSG